MFIGNCIVRDFVPRYGAIRDFGGRDCIVRDFIHGYGEGGDFLVGYRAILDILRVDYAVSAHTERDLDPLDYVAI